jgi:pentatricopeptide repeat protein
MKEEKFEFNLKIYNTLIESYIKKYDIVASLNVYKEMIQHGIEPNSETLFHLLEIFLVKLDSRFEIVYKGFIDKNIEIDEKCLRMYFKCLCLISNDVEFAFKFASQHNLWNKESFQLILKSCAIKKDIHQALSIYNFMIENNVKMDVDLFNNFIETFSNAGDYRIFRLFDHFGDLTPNVESFNLLLKPTCLKNDLIKAKKIYEEMRRRNLDPDVVTHNMFLSPLFHQKWKPHIESLMKKQKSE